MDTRLPSKYANATSNAVHDRYEALVNTQCHFPWYKHLAAPDDVSLVAMTLIQGVPAHIHEDNKYDRVNERYILLSRHIVLFFPDGVETYNITDLPSPIGGGRCRFGIDFAEALDRFLRRHLPVMFTAEPLKGDQSDTMEATIVLSNVISDGLERLTDVIDVASDNLDNIKVALEGVDKTLLCS